MSVKNSTNESNLFSGVIDYFVTDRNNKLVINDKLIIINGSKNVRSMLNETSTNHNTNSQIHPINIQLNSTQTSELLPGPSKLKLIITTLDSPKPTIHESTLIARP
jgi:peptide/nickel transport system substrate-binding protein